MTAMFGEQLYPTPPDVVDMMVKPYIGAGYSEWGGVRYKNSLHFKAILDPSAGTAAILLYLVNEYGVKKNQCHAIEIDFSLQSIIIGHGFSVVGTDYLEETIREHYDFIIANPPFRNGTTHLRKMWNDLYAGDIACLLNAQSIHNPNSEDDRVVIELIKKYGVHGGTQFIGNAFSEAERETDVEVVIVWLHKDEPQIGARFEYGDFEKDFNIINDEAFQANPLANADLFQAIVDQYNAAADILVEIDKKQKEFVFYTSALKWVERGEDNRSLNEKLRDLKKDFWKYVFDKTKLGKITTSNYQKKFEEQQAAINNLAFSYTNICMVQDVFMFNLQDIMQQCILEVFDKAIGYSPENKVALQWKTNSSYKLNKKIIVPNGIEYYGKYSNSWRPNYDKRNFFNDLDKALCFVSGTRVGEISGLYNEIVTRLDKLDRQDTYEINGVIFYYSTPFETRFFEVKFFKRGTVHLKFRDEGIWQDFNVAAAKGKGWLGDGS